MQIKILMLQVLAIFDKQMKHKLIQKHKKTVFVNGVNIVKLISETIACIIV